MIKAGFLTFFLAFSFCSLSIFAESGSGTEPKSEISIFPVSELREGMRGTAKTVFRGSRSEEFNVEILGVVPDWIGPKQDMIIGRLSGANAERTFVFAGMSGSPVYIDGKLVGAISYSFPFAKEPICGITPFEQMRSAVETEPSRTIASHGQKSFSYTEFLSYNWPSSVPAGPSHENLLLSGYSSDSKLMAIAGQTFKQIATPLTFSGISQKALDLFAPELLAAGVLPVAAPGGASRITPMKATEPDTLLGGDSVVVHLSRGDIDMAAAGTVTLRDGNKIYAFGHPFFGLGTASLPMAESHVVTVVPNANNSFKLAVSDAMVGTMTQDRTTGIFGMLGQVPRMLPVKIKLKTSRGNYREVNFESAIDEVLTPLIVNMGIASTLLSNERSLGDMTVETTGEIAVKNEDSIKFSRRSTGAQAVGIASASAAVPVNALLRAGFEGLDITGVTINMAVSDGSKTARLDRIAADRSQAKAGETVELTSFARNEAGKILIQKIPVTIPIDAAPGTVTLTIGDGSSVQQNSPITQFTPKSAGEMIATINRIKRPDRLYAVLSRTAAGAVMGVSELPNLPPSVLATINNDRTTGGTKPTVQTVLSELELPSGEYIVSGSQSLTIEIIR